MENVISETKRKVSIPFRSKFMSLLDSCGQCFAHLNHFAGECENSEIVRLTN